MRIICSADFSQYSQRPGALDNRMTYVLGLMGLGHDVYLFEEVTPKRTYNERYQPVPFRQWPGKDKFADQARAFGVAERFCLIYNSGEDTYGMSLEAALRIARSADMLI